MTVWLLLLFIVVPAIEIALFIWTGSHIGALSVFLLIILTGVLGSLIVRFEGVETWRRAQESIMRGEIPKDEIFDGICILIGAVLIITPGFFTDVIGFLILFPLTRKPFRSLLKYYIAKQISNGKIIFRKW
mgnify:CR=1 FL=1